MGSALTVVTFHSQLGLGQILAENGDMLSGLLEASY
jgi:hypothetical protein